MSVVRDLSPQEVKDLKQNRERLKFDEKHEGQRELTNDEVKAMEEFIMKHPNHKYWDRGGEDQ